MSDDVAKTSEAFGRLGTVLAHMARGSLSWQQANGDRLGRAFDGISEERRDEIVKATYEMMVAGLAAVPGADLRWYLDTIVAPRPPTKERGQ